MKRLTLFLICHLLFCKISFCQNQWQWLNPKPSGYPCLKVVFTDFQTGFILNSNGDLIKTNDQGNAWRIIGNFPHATCMNIADSTGVIAGDSGTVYVSVDNGNSWNPANSGIIDHFQFVNIVSRDSFFVSANSGVIYETRDRGRTWATLNCNSTINCITFVNSMIGFAGSSTSGILKTTDGGHNWQASEQVNYSPSSILAIQFLNQDTGYAFREYDSLLVTHDGGNTWKGYNGYQTMYTIDFVNSRLGYMGGTDGALYRSVDGGANWTSISPPNGFKYAYDISSLDFISADTGFAVGFLGRIMKTTDSGQTWVSYSPTYSGISSVTFGSPSTGYATNGSYILKTTDTGRTWNTLGLTTGTDFGSSSAFKYAHFTSADTGYVISNHYVEVHKTSDGGQSWTTLNPAGAGYEDVPGVSYPDPKTDILSLGTLLVETKDGGNSWNSLWSAQYSNQYFANIFYVNATTAYATSFSTNQLYKTTDGFQTWNLVFTNSLGYSITGIWFVNPQKGFITDDETEIFMTNDGGNTWQSVPFAESFIYDTFNSTIRFFNEQVGYLTNGNIFGPGSYGRIYKTVDGGQSWQLSYKIGGSSISFTPDSNVVIAGFGGTILKSPIKGWQIDSFTVNTNNSCGEILSASIGAALSEVDSIQFVITGPGGSTSLISTNPVLIKNNRATCVSVINDLTPDSTYSARVKFLYNGTYVYSNPLNFVARGFPAPYIYDSAGVLLSSSPFGNQWYLNGTAISGASQQQWAAKTSGNYTVQVTQDNCTSPMSIPLKFIANNLGIIIYPNPSKDYFYIMNTQNRTLSINIRDITGRLVTSHSLNYSGTAINVNKLSQGEYIVNIWDEKSHQTTNILFLKL